MTVESLVGLLRQEEPKATTPPTSIFYRLGKTPTLRTGEDIVKQIQDEREA